MFYNCKRERRDNPCGYPLWLWLHASVDESLTEKAMLGFPWGKLARAVKRTGD